MAARRRCPRLRRTLILDQTVKVRFDASLEQGMPWTFKPVVRSVDVRIGETGAGLL
jgi:cytochrome c oxidase assembly protein Cox11